MILLLSRFAYFKILYLSVLATNYAGELYDTKLDDNNSMTAGAYRSVFPIIIYPTSRITTSKIPNIAKNQKENGNSGIENLNQEKNSDEVYFETTDTDNNSGPDVTENDVVEIKDDPVTPEYDVIYKAKNAMQPIPDTGKQNEITKQSTRPDIEDQINSDKEITGSTRIMTLDDNETIEVLLTEPLTKKAIRPMKLSTTTQGAKMLNLKPNIGRKNQNQQGNKINIISTLKKLRFKAVTANQTNQTSSALSTLKITNDDKHQKKIKYNGNKVRQVKHNIEIHYADEVISVFPPNIVNKTKGTKSPIVKELGKRYEATTRDIIFLLTSLSPPKNSDFPPGWDTYATTTSKTNNKKLSLVTKKITKKVSVVSRALDEMNSTKPPICICSTVYEPVCASNLQNYNNVCLMECDRNFENLKVLHNGICKIE